MNSKVAKTERFIQNLNQGVRDDRLIRLIRLKLTLLSTALTTLTSSIGMARGVANIYG